MSLDVMLPLEHMYILHLVPPGKRVNLQSMLFNIRPLKLPVYWARRVNLQRHY